MTAPDRSQAMRQAVTEVIANFGLTPDDSLEPTVVVPAPRVRDVARRLGLASAAGAGGMASFSLRTTGASTVDEAERTNSPSSANLASTTLLSTPSSLASS